MTNSFCDIRFDPGILPRGTGAVTYETSIIRTGSDLEKRNPLRHEWLFEGDIGEVLLHAHQVSYIIAFFSARKGKAEGFRYRYWGDYQASLDPTELGPNTSSQSWVEVIEHRTVQMCKKYTDNGIDTYKRITNPVKGAITVYLNTTPVTEGFTIDYSQGYIYFEDFPGQPVNWSGEFDIPVWFDTDTLPSVHVYNANTQDPFYPQDGMLYRFDSLPIIELPMKTIPLDLPPAKSAI